jgi:hypothetical protein
MKTRCVRGRRRADRLDALVRCAEELLVAQRRSEQPNDPTVTAFALRELAEACLARRRALEPVFGGELS